MTAMRRGAIIVTLALALVNVACRKPEPGQLVLVVPRATDGQFWRTVRAGASQGAKDEGAFLEWPSHFAPDDIKGQANVLRAARDRARAEGRRYAFAFAPIWGVGFRELIREWEADDFRLDTFDEELAQSPGHHFVTHVGTANLQAGQDAATALLAQVRKTITGRKANVAILRLNPLSGSTTTREQGFLQVMAEASNREIATVVSRDHYAIGVGIESAFFESLALLDESVKLHTPIDAIFCPNESTTSGMLRALENRRMAGKVIFVGFDQSPILANALWNGSIHALMLQDPYTMGYKSVRRALDVLKMSSAEYLERVRGEDFSMTETQHRSVSLDDLQKCQRYARLQGLPDLSGRPLADALLKSARAKEDQCLKNNGTDCHPMYYTNIADPSLDMGEPNCNLNVLDLLYPPVEIWHLASPGRFRQ